MISNVEEQRLELQHGIRIEWISVGWMIVEAIVAIGAGVRAHSIALIAFGADSVVELAAGAILLWRLSVEADGASGERLGLVERRAERFVGAALLLLAFYIVVASVRALLLHEGPAAASLGISITAASSILMPILARAKRRIGARIESRALEADGACSMVCAYMSWIVLAGVAATALLGWWWIDSIAALGIVYFVFHEGWEAIAG